MYSNQELGLCIEFGPVRVDSVRRGGGPPPPPGSNPPCAGSRRRGLLPGLLVIACYLSFTPSSLKYFSYTWGLRMFEGFKFFGLVFLWVWSTFFGSQILKSILIGAKGASISARCDILSIHI